MSIWFWLLLIIVVLLVIALGAVVRFLFKVLEAIAGGFGG